MNTPPVKYLSVCSGIEAASVAFEPIGWEPIAFSEIEAFPSAVLAYHYPTVPNLGDMTKWREWDWDMLSGVDVLVGGTPCQAFSVAGLRAGLDDERGQLTISYIHILDYIDEVRSLYGKEPAICIWENVPGVLSSKDNAFGAFLGGLAGEDCELVPAGGKWTDAGCVYGPKRSVAWRVLDAQYFGVAQRRKRVFVVASARDFDPSEILFEFDGVRRDTPPSREAGQGFAEAVGGSATFKDTPILNDQGGSVMNVEDGLVGTLRRETHGHEPIVFEQCYGVDNEANATNGFFGTLTRGGQGGTSQTVAYSIIGDVTPKIGEDVCLTMRSQGGGGIVPPSVVTWWDGGQCAGTLTKEGAGGNQRMPDTGGNHAVAIQGSMIGREDKNGPQGDGLNEEVSFTLNCVDRHAVAFAQNTRDEVREMAIVGALAASPGMKQTSYIREAMQVRRLTPIECERLQGFRDGWTDVPYRNKPAADGPRYKSLGNSMATPVMHWIGRRINDALIRMG